MDDPVPISEAKLAVGSVLDRVPAFVHEAMVVPAEENEVVDGRLPTLRPVQPVVGLQMTSPRASGPPAAPVVPRFQQVAERGRHGATLAADAEREAVALDARDALRVTGEPPSGFGRDGRAFFEL